MARNFGIPYMGSKQKLADKIVPFILNRHPDTTDFYDLFGGGASISLYAVNKYPHIATHYNELSRAISALVIYLSKGGQVPTDFVTQKDFLAKRNGSDWYAGFLQTCWCFGNNQRDYLYGQDLEEFKHLYHNTVVNGDNNLEWLANFVDEHAARKHGKKIKTNLYLDFKRYKTIYQRRIVLSRQLPYINQLEHFARIERLHQIAKWSGIDDLNITAGISYSQVPISGNKPLVYCDPPYENTREYKEGGFNHAEFYEWAATREYPVYFSSYKISDTRFKLVKAINTRALFDHRTRQEGGVYNFENIYWNGKN